MWTSQCRWDTSSSPSTKTVFFLADFIPHQNPWLDSSMDSRPYKHKLRTPTCSSLLPEHPCTIYLPWFCLYPKCLKNKNKNPRIRHHSMVHKNQIEWCRIDGNWMASMIVQSNWQKDARRMIYDFMCRGIFVETYSEFQRVSRLDFDWYSSTGCQGRGLRCDFALYRAPRWISEFKFPSFFPKLFWPFLQSFVRPLGLDLLCAYNRMCLG